MGQVRVVTVSIAAAALTIGCSGPAGLHPVDRVDADRMRDVAGDEGASPAEIVQAGSARDAARSRDAVLVAYTVHGGTSEGRSAAAWRLYDADGDRVAEAYAGLTEEGSAHADVIALPDGFLVADQEGPWWYVATDGAREKVSRTTEPMAARPGDVPLDDGSGRLFRPATRTLFSAAPEPRRHRQGWVAAADGTVWMQGAGIGNGAVPFFRSTGGRPWEPVASHDPGRRRWVSGLALAAVGDRIVVPVLAEGRRPDRARLESLLVRSATAPADQPWQVLAVRDAGEDNWWDVRVAALDATTALVGAWGSQQYVVDLTDATWRSMEAPTDEDSWSYETENGRIYATHFDHADAWFTDDRGESWDRLPH